MEFLADNWAAALRDAFLLLGIICLALGFLVREGRGNARGLGFALVVVGAFFVACASARLGVGMAVIE